MAVETERMGEPVWLVPNMTLMHKESDDSCGVVPDVDAIEMTRWLLSGSTTIVTAAFGILGNIISMAILLKRSMRSVFNHLLAALCASDIIFLITNLSISLIASFENLMYLLPFAEITSHVTLALSIFITISITVERYQVVSSAHLYQRRVDVVGHNRLLLYYLVPSLVCAVLFNIPSMYIQSKGAEANNPSQGYIKFQIIFQLFHPFTTTGLLPLLVLGILNYKIYTRIPSQPFTSPAAAHAAAAGGNNNTEFASAASRRAQRNSTISVEETTVVNEVNPDAIERGLGPIQEAPADSDIVVKEDGDELYSLVSTEGDDFEDQSSSEAEKSLAGESRVANGTKSDEAGGRSRLERLGGISKGRCRPLLQKIWRKHAQQRSAINKGSMDSSNNYIGGDENSNGKRSSLLQSFKKQGAGNGKVDINADMEMQELQANGGCGTFSPPPSDSTEAALTSEAVTRVSLISTKSVNFHQLRASVQNSAVRGMKQRPGGPRRRHAGDFRLAQLVIVLVLIFLVLNSPRLAIGIYEGDYYMPHTGQWITDLVAQYAAILNSTLNFIIYCMMGSKFRKILRESVQQCRKSNETRGDNRR